MKKDVTIYVAAHKPFDRSGSLPKGYVPLQVGAEGKQDLGFVRDNTGEHISEKNGSYCELTGLYWMWKNTSSDIVGLCHYRRYFSHRPLDRKLSAVLTEEQIEKILEKNDIILPRRVNLGRKNVYEHYCAFHYEKDLQMTREAVVTLYPEYAESFDAVMASHKTYQCNMFIASKELADAYCKWLFDVLQYVEDHTDISEYDAVQKRIYGYLSERLLAVWVHHQKLKICHKWYASTELTMKMVIHVLKDKLKKAK